MRDSDISKYLYFKFQTALAENELQRRSVEDKFKQNDTEDYLIDSFKVVCLLKEEHEKLSQLEDAQARREKKRALEEDETLTRSCNSLYIYKSRVSTESMKEAGVKKRRHSKRDTVPTHEDMMIPEDIFKASYPVDGPLPYISFSTQRKELPVDSELPHLDF